MAFGKRKNHESGQAPESEGSDSSKDSNPIRDALDQLGIHHSSARAPEGELDSHYRTLEGHTEGIVGTPENPENLTLFDSAEELLNDIEETGLLKNVSTYEFHANKEGLVGEIARRSLEILQPLIELSNQSVAEIRTRIEAAQAAQADQARKRAEKLSK